MKRSKRSGKGYGQNVPSAQPEYPRERSDLDVLDVSRVLRALRLLAK